MTQFKATFEPICTCLFFLRIGNLNYLLRLVVGCIDSMERGTVEWNSGTVEWNGGMWANDPVPPLLVICTCAPSHAFRVTLCAWGV